MVFVCASRLYSHDQEVCAGLLAGLALGGRAPWKFDPLATPVVPLQPADLPVNQLAVVVRQALWTGAFAITGLLVGAYSFVGYRLIGHSGLPSVEVFRAPALRAIAWIRSLNLPHQLLALSRRLSSKIKK